MRLEDQYLFLRHVVVVPLLMIVTEVIARGVTANVTTANLRSDGTFALPCETSRSQSSMYLGSSDSPYCWFQSYQRLLGIPTRSARTLDLQRHVQ